MATNKPKIAFFDFSSCEGCQLTVVDSLQTHTELLDVVEIVQFREAMSERGEDYQIAFVEGSCTRLEDEARLKSIREQASLVIALGACAHLGGVNSLRNWQAHSDVHRYVYGEMGKLQSDYSARPIAAVIPIDGAIPGCPIDREELIRIVKVLLQGRQLRLPDYPICVECRLRENVCVFLKGVPCMGSVTIAGCNAICPAYGMGCEGCRGAIPNPNFDGLKLALREHGMDESLFDEKMRLFQSYQLMESEAVSHGSH